VLPQRLAYNIESTRERRVPEAALALSGSPGADRSRERLFRIDEFGLGLGQGRGQRRASVSITSKLTAPDFERLAFTPCPMASLASSGIKALSWLLARSCSRKALRVLRKSTANSAQEFEALISTMRIASMRGRGGSALIR
jgi:hypothetical protein